MRFRMVCALALVVWVTAIAATQNPQQTAGLRIVAVEGEDAVNVIQQKSAVAPVVEVRDRNDQPVAGAIVRFAISRGRASFNGARTLTVTTNAAGRAIATGLTPTGSGALQISAAATFQGQTAAITIAQTNVMTAAAAGTGAGTGGAGGGATAGSGGSAGVGGGAAGGGGLSATTVGIVGGAVAGGALATKEVLGGGGSKTAYQGPYSGLVADVFFGASAGCTRTLQHDGTVELDLDIASDGSVTGDAHIKGTMAMAQVKPGCELPGNPQSHGDEGPVQGTKEHITFHGSHGGLTPDVTANYDFAGTLTGASITGIFTLDINSNCCRTLGTFPVTLQKQ
jgi:hypothetical protein